MEASSNSLLEKQQSTARCGITTCNLSVQEAESGGLAQIWAIQGYIVNSRYWEEIRVPARSDQTLRTHIKGMIMAECTFNPSTWRTTETGGLLGLAGQSA